MVAALQNPQRKCLSLFVTAPLLPEISPFLGKVPYTIVDKKDLEAKFPGAVHQGIALQVHPLPSPSLQEFCHNLSLAPLILVLDHVTDPQNAGALIRTAAALNVDAVIVTHRHSPPPQGAFAKSASGGLEHIPLISVPNLAQALEELKKKGFWCIGLCEKGTLPLSPEAIDMRGPLALVVGAEGEGLRRLTQVTCDILAFLPTSPHFSTLNASTAGAIALYELSRSRKTHDSPHTFSSVR